MDSQDDAAAVSACQLFGDLIPNLAERAEIFRVDVDVLDEEIHGIYANQIRDLVNSLTAACREHNTEIVRKHAHSLEGTGGTMGFPEISIVGWELSAAAKKPDWDRCAAIAERLKRWSLSLG